MIKYVDRYKDKEVIKRRKLRFKIWLNSQKNADREILKRFTINDLLKNVTNKPIKKADLDNRMFEIYEEFLHGNVPALRKYFK